MSGEVETVPHAPARLGAEFFADSVRVKTVRAHSAASRAKIQADDVVRRCNGQRIQSWPDLQAVVANMEPGDHIPFELQRGSERITTSVVAGHSVSTELRSAGMRLSARRSGFQNVIPHDGLIAPTACGGPVFDIRGRFLGINIARVSRPRTILLPQKELQKCLRQFEQARPAALPKRDP